jgi:hypothetical protein
MLYVNERQRQRKQDEKEFKNKLDDIEFQYEREKSLIIQSNEAEIIMLNQELDQYRKRERELNQREYQAKSQLKTNTSNAAELYTHIFNISKFFSKESAEVHRFLDNADIKTRKYIE